MTLADFHPSVLTHPPEVFKPAGVLPVLGPQNLPRAGYSVADVQPPGDLSAPVNLARGIFMEGNDAASFYSPVPARPCGNIARTTAPEDHRNRP